MHTWGVMSCNLGCKQPLVNSPVLPVNQAIKLKISNHLQFVAQRPSSMCLESKVYADLPF